MSIYPKASSPITPAVLRAANERAERWRIRCMEARSERDQLSGQLNDALEALEVSKRGSRCMRDHD